MKQLILIVMMAALIPVSALANISLKPVDFHLYQKSVYESALQQSIASGVPAEHQVFNVNVDGEKSVTFIAGKGFDGKDNNVCFVSLADGHGRVAVTIPTIGFNQWEAETCTATRAVSIIAQKDHRAKIAVIYEAASPNATAWESVLFDLNNSGLTVDKVLTNKVGSQGAESVGELKILINKIEQ
jgi:hypothetical protein